jgi:hypothetical protein
MMKGFKLYFLLIFIGLAINSKAQNRSFMGLLGGGEGVTQSFIFGNSNPVPPSYDLSNWWKAHSNYGGFSVTNSGVRSGNSAYTSSGGGTAGVIHGPLISIAGNSNKKWVLQFYGKYNGGGVNGSSSVSLGYQRATDVSGNGQSSTYSFSPSRSSTTYLKYTLTNVGTTLASYIALRAVDLRGGDNGTSNIDDIAIYETDDGLVDDTAPDAPTNLNSALNSICPGSATELSWSGPATGTDGGGYLVVRYSTNPAANDLPNVNGIYEFGNTITNTNTGSVVYQGANTAFTDSTCFSNTTYYYNVFTYDKAYNYSTAATTSIATADIGPSTITAVMPDTGPMSASITITGTNFNFVPRFNDVWFGPVKGIITAATGTQLTVTIPKQSTNEIISHLNYASRKTGKASVPFRTLFSGKLNSGSMWSVNTTRDLGGNQLTRNVVFGDLNLDNKAEEVVVSGNSTSYGLRILTNTTTAGSASDISFANSFGLSCPSKPIDLKLSDFNGDGKLDIVFVSVATNNTLSVYKNNYVSGTTLASTSFGTRLDISTGSTGGGEKLYVSVGDIDGDGLPDIVTKLESSYFSIFLNNSSNGNISFGPRNDISVGDWVSGISVGDLDKDGKNDIIIASENLSSLFVYKNNSTVGNISLGTPVYLSVDAGSQHIKVFDIDLDGYLDIVATCTSAAKVNIFKNLLSSTSPSGSNFTSSNFGNKIALTTGTSPLGFDYADLDGDGLIDLGVVNNGTGIVSLFKNTSSVGTISFSSKIDYFISNTSLWSMALVDLNYDNLPDMAFTANNGTSVIYRRNYPFPSISNITNNKCANSIVTITGSNLDDATSVTVGGTSINYAIVSVSSITFTATAGVTGLVSVVAPLGTATFATAFALGTPTAATITANSPTTRNANGIYQAYDIVSLTAGNGSTYVWSGGTSKNTALNTFKSSGKYQVTMTTSSGCVSSTIVQVLVIVKGLNAYGNVTEDPIVQVTPNGDINRNYAVDKNGIIRDTRSEQDGSSEIKAGTSAYQIKLEYPNSVDGIYWVKNDNLNSGTAFQIYADMTTEGGGWMLLNSSGGGAASTEITSITSLSTQGYLPRATVIAMSNISTSVLIKSGPDRTSGFTYVALSTDSRPITSLRSGDTSSNGAGTWHNSVYTSFSPLVGSATWSDVSGVANGWPNMFHSNGNSGAVHWLPSYSQGAGVNWDSGNYYSTWIR